VAGAVHLIADRFAEIDNAKERRAIDLATGDHVVLVTGPAATGSEPIRRAVRCDFFSRLHHRGIARLVDYGPIDDGQWFEAWRCGLSWRRARADGEQVISRVRAFLRANQLTIGRLSIESVRDWHGCPIVLPDPSMGHEDPSGTSSESDVDIESCGITQIERPAVAAVADMLAEPCTARPRAIALWAEPGAGGSVAVGELARTARTHGLIPLGAANIDTLTPELLAAIESRTLCILDTHGGTAAWRRLLEGVLGSGKAHVLVYVGHGELPGARTLQLDGVAREALLAAIRPAVRSGALCRQLERAAARAHGLPGLFTRALWGPGPVVRTAPARVMRSIAAEQAAVYGEDRGRRQLDAAMALLERGRYAPADRAMRSAVGSLARRRDWDGAIRGSVALAGALLKRGRAADAQAVLEEAKSYAEKGEQHAGLLRVAEATGTTWLELGRLDEAESALRAAYTMARATDEPPSIVSTALALSRCLFWRGKYDEADTVLEPLDNDEQAPPSLVRVRTLRSRAATGRGDLRSALSRAASAIERAKQLPHSAALAEAATASALAHLHASDPRGVEQDVAVSLQSAHISRDPVAAMKARLILAEQERRGGRTAAARQLVSRSRRLILPATLRARLALAADLAAGTAVADAVRRHTSASGFQALALFAPIEGNGDHRAHVALDAAVDILHLCQAAEDEQTVLTRVCARLRDRLEACGVALFAAEGHSAIQMGSDGSRIDAALAQRVIAGRLTVAPHQHNERLEGGAPIRYAGVVVGAVVARWTIGARPQPSHVHMILTVAAAAAGPAVAAAVARRRQAAQASPGELIGASAVMADVRRAVDRAAGAPFAVLIEGESGSGKELVARALHRRSPRSDRPFATLNCAALPEDLVEAELFGHGRGAFTGAITERSGVFESAHTGTLFLDEIAELSPRAQAKILRTIQEGELRRIGENAARRIDVRIVSATNRDLRHDVAANRFRLDLLYRLDVIRIVVPPLRDRPEDIAALAEHFWREATARLGSRATLSAATLGALARYHWPGNVRELQNVLAALAVRSPRRGVVPPTALPPPFSDPIATDACRLTEARRTFEEQFVRAALVRTGGHRGRAAEELGVTRQGLAKLMMRLQIDDQDQGSGSRHGREIV
jgi:DNA-binding NtrC family response regulator/tetratricopeptide (TPR) repeat protein